MVFMQPRDEGHPLAAMLVLSSVFAFALVFHTVTEPGAHVPARYDRQLAALVSPQIPVVPVVPRVSAVRVVRAVHMVPAVRVAAGTTATSGTPETSGTILHAFAWPTMPAPFPAAASPFLPSDAARDGGAVTRALATTGSALRNAFRKTF
jgi:hypothetical protein